MGSAIGGRAGAIIAFVLAVVMNHFSRWHSDKLVLKRYGAQPFGPNDAPAYYSSLQRPAERSGLPIPKVYIIPSQILNAFASGRTFSKPRWPPSPSSWPSTRFSIASERGIDAAPESQPLP